MTYPLLLEERVVSNTGSNTDCLAKETKGAKRSVPPSIGKLNQPKFRNPFNH